MKKQSARDAECIVLWASNDKVVPEMQHQYSYLTCMSLYTVLYICYYSVYVCFLVLYVCFLFCMFRIFLVVLCIVSPFVYSSLFPNFYLFIKLCHRV